MFYYVAKFFATMFMKLMFRIEVVGSENIPKTGGIVVCGNHVSNYDAVLVGICMKRAVSFMAKKELYDVKGLSFLVKRLKTIPIDRSKTDMAAFKTAIKVLRQGGVIGIFAQGTRVKEGEDKKAKGGAALFALTADVPVVPVAISGSFKKFQKLTIKFGTPITLEEYAGKRPKTPELDTITEKIMTEIESLKMKES